MATATFDQLKNKLDAEGYTQKDGRNGIKLVEELIKKFSKRPNSSWEAESHDAHCPRPRANQGCLRFR
jgi:hypothetical protein